MSLIRWGEDNSDLYVIGSCESDGWVCICCPLKAERQDPMSDAELLLHFKEHEDCGNNVPSLAYRRLNGAAQESNG